jgi:manganese-dependent inorganic pyrophosphatase
MEETIYVIGHKSPDTDTICSAIAYSEYLKLKGLNAIPAKCGEINPETKFVLDSFSIEEPTTIDSVADKKVVLVDHNEKSQSPEGIDNAKIIGIVDHHKIGFSSNEPIEVEMKPFGSTATIIARKMISEGLVVDKKVAGLLLSAILSDTVIFKSSTTTKIDIETAEELNKIVGLEDMKSFGIEMKKKKSSLSGFTAEQIIKSDFKIFESSVGNFGIGQIETADLSEGLSRKEELLKEMSEIKTKEGLMFLILMLTDIINEGSELLISEGFELKDVFNKEIKGNSVYIEKMMSRKKDLLPIISSVLK